MLASPVEELGKMEELTEALKVEAKVPVWLDVAEIDTRLLLSGVVGVLTGDEIVELVACERELMEVAVDEIGVLDELEEPDVELESGLLLSCVVEAPTKELCTGVPEEDRPLPPSCVGDVFVEELCACEFELVKSPLVKLDAPVVVGEFALVAESGLLLSGVDEALVRELSVALESVEDPDGKVVLLSCVGETLEPVGTNVLIELVGSCVAVESVEDPEDNVLLLSGVGETTVEENCGVCEFELLIPLLDGPDGEGVTLEVTNPLDVPVDEIVEVGFVTVRDE